MRQHRIVASQQHSSRLVGQSQSTYPSQPHAWDLSQCVPAPPPPLQSAPDAGPNVTQTQRSTQRACTQSERTPVVASAYEVPASMQRSFIRVPPPPPPPAQRQPPLTAASQRTLQAEPLSEVTEAHTQALAGLTDVLTQWHRERAAQRDVDQLLRSRAATAQEQLTAVLADCVVELRGLRAALTASASAVARPTDAPVSVQAPSELAQLPRTALESRTQPTAVLPAHSACTRAAHRRTSTLGINPVWRFGEARNANTLSTSVSSPQLFPEPAAAAAAVAAPAHRVTGRMPPLVGPVKRRRTESAHSDSAAAAADTPRNAADTIHEAVNPRQMAQTSPGISFFQDSEEDGVYLL